MADDTEGFEDYGGGLTPSMMAMIASGDPNAMLMALSNPRSQSANGASSRAATAAGIHPILSGASMAPKTSTVPGQGTSTLTGSGISPSLRMIAANNPALSPSSPEAKNENLIAAGAEMAQNTSPYLGPAIGAGLQGWMNMKAARAAQSMAAAKLEQESAFKNRQLDILDAYRKAQEAKLSAPPGPVSAAGKAALDMGLTPGTPAFAKKVEEIEKNAKISITNTPENKGNSALLEGFAKADVADYQAAQKAAQDAALRKQNIQGFMNAQNSGTFKTGSFAGPRAAIGQAMLLVGMDPTSVPIIGNPAAKEIMDANSDALAMQAIGDVQKIRGSNMALGMTKAQVVQATRTEAGNQAIAALADKASDLSIAESELWDQARKNKTTDEIQPKLKDLRSKYAEDSKPIIKSILSSSKKAPNSWSEVIGEGDEESTQPPKAGGPDTPQRKAGDLIGTTPEGKKVFLGSDGKTPHVQEE